MPNRSRELWSRAVQYTRDPDEFREQLAVQLRHLRRSADAYDRGDESEAQRLAVVIRNVVHDTRTSVSLLTHLGMKGAVHFLDTVPPQPEVPPGAIVLFDTGLVAIRAGLPSGDVRFAPRLGDLGELERWADFATWWTRPVLNDQEGHRFSRQDFVLGVANQDGGAHIDATLRPGYAALTRGGSFGVLLQSTDGEMRPQGRSLAFACVRQIAHELDATLSAGK
jgi:hypothetical protein